MHSTLGGAVTTGPKRTDCSGTTNRERSPCAMPASRVSADRSPSCRITASMVTGAPVLATRSAARTSSTPPDVRMPRPQPSGVCIVAYVSFLGSDCAVAALLRVACDCCGACATCVLAQPASAEPAAVPMKCRRFTAMVSPAVVESRFFEPGRAVSIGTISEPRRPALLLGQPRMSIGIRPSRDLLREAAVRPDVLIPAVFADCVATRPFAARPSQEFRMQTPTAVALLVGLAIASGKTLHAEPAVQDSPAKPAVSHSGKAVATP